MNKLQRILMAGFIFLFPIIYPIGSTMNLREFQEISFQYLAMILCTFFVGNLVMPLFMAWTVFLFYLNGGHIGASSVLNVFLGIMLYGISSKFFQNFRFDKEAVWIGRVALVSLLFMLLQSFGIDPLHLSMNYQTGVNATVDFLDKVGIMNLKAHNGILMGLLSVYLSSVNPLFGLIGLYPVYLSESTGAILAAIVGLLFYVYWTRRKWFLTLVAIMAIAGSLSCIKDFKADPKMYLSRFATWHLTARQILMRPIGYGPDSYRNITPYKDFVFAGDEDRRAAIGILVPGTTDQFQFVYYHPKPSVMFSPEYRKLTPKSPNVWDHPHNEILNLLFCWGLPGFILVAIFICGMVKRFLDSDKNREVVMLAAMLLVFAVSSMVQFPFCVARLGYLIPILLGAYKAATEPI